MEAERAGKWKPETGVVKGRVEARATREQDRLETLHFTPDGGLTCDAAAKGLGRGEAKHQGKRSTPASTAPCPFGLSATLLAGAPPGSRGASSAGPTAPNAKPSTKPHGCSGSGPSVNCKPCATRNCASGIIASSAPTLACSGSRTSGKVDRHAENPSHRKVRQYPRARHGAPTTFRHWARMPTDRNEIGRGEEAPGVTASLF